MSWTGCFVLHGCSIALIWQGTSQVRIQRWHQAKHPWIGRMRIQRDYAFIKWVKVLEFAPQVESLCLHITHNLQCCYFLLAEPHICISVKEKYEVSASPSDKQIGKSKKKSLSLKTNPPTISSKAYYFTHSCLLLLGLVKYKTLLEHKTNNCMAKPDRALLSLDSRGRPAEVKNCSLHLNPANLGTDSRDRFFFWAQAVHTWICNYKYTWQS